MSSTVSPAFSTAGSRRRRPSSWRAALVTTLVPLGTAAAIVGVMAAAASPPEGVADAGFSVAFLVWNLLPVAGATVLLLWAGRRGWLPYAAATVGCLALALLTAWALHDFWASESSTAALMFIFLPLYQWTVVGVTGGLIALAVAASRRPAS